jgi:threonylcarbamoyladenosine tRNA methylthiotransferase MtaB
VTYAIMTMGCKLNQFDSAQVSGRLRSTLQEAATVEEADLLILNTCTVTHKADREAAKIIRSLRRANPRAVIAVMGCSTRLDAESYRNMAEVDAVLESRESLEAFLQSMAPQDAKRDHACVPHFGGRTRAFLKVQEGCNFPCTYCIIPAVRGRSRSVPPAQVKDEFKSLLDAGYREVVLTGINTGEYGRDLGLRGGLTALLETLLSLDGVFRIRLNSVEPRAVTNDMMTLIKGEERLAKHLQIPLQSGSDEVLKAMRRNYRSAFYVDLINRLAETVPAIGIGTDVLLGFPTESEEDFKATLRVLQFSPLAYVHAFTYSPRPGTPAAELPGHSPAVTGSRTAAVRALARAKTEAFARRFVGLALPAITLAPESGRGRALTDNFLSVTLDGRCAANRLVRVIVESVTGEEIRGRLAGPS